MIADNINIYLELIIKYNKYKLKKRMNLIEMKLIIENAK